MNLFEKFAVVVGGTALVGAIGANLYISATSSVEAPVNRPMVCVNRGDGPQVVYRDNGQVFAQAAGELIDSSSIMPWARTYQYADAEFADGIRQDSAFNVYGPNSKFPLGSCLVGADGEEVPMVSDDAVPIPSMVLTGQIPQGPSGMGN